MALKTYDSQKVIIGFHGFLLGGFAPGTFVEAERDEESFKKVVGADGEVARAANANKSGTVKLTLLQTSASNDVLNSELKRDELTNLAVGPFFIQDLSGRTLVSAGEAWIEKSAPAKFGAEIDGVEWTIAVAKMQLDVAGN